MSRARYGTRSVSDANVVADVQRCSREGVSGNARKEEEVVVDAKIGWIDGGYNGLTFYLLCFLFKSAIKTDASGCNLNCKQL